jgi:intracellular multiplication protein IcmC
MATGFDATTLINSLMESGVIIQDFAIITGLMLFFAGLHKLKRYGETRTFQSSQMTMTGPLVMIICGTLLMSTPFLINTVLVSFWGKNAVNQIPGGGVPQLKNLENAIVIFVRIIGIGAFIRGWIILAKSGGEGSQPGTRGKAITHIFAGLLLIHIMLTMDLIKGAMGFT